MSTGKQPNSHARPLSVKGIASAIAPAKSRDIILSHCCGSPNWDTTTAGHKQAAYLCQMLNRQIISLCSLWIQVANFSLKDISFCPIPFSNVCKPLSPRSEESTVNAILKVLHAIKENI